MVRVAESELCKPDAVRSAEQSCAEKERADAAAQQALPVSPRLRSLALKPQGRPSLKLGAQSVPPAVVQQVAVQPEPPMAGLQLPEVARAQEP